MFIGNENRTLSLIEQKKIQWAKEKDEIAKLGEMFSSTDFTSNNNNNRQFERTSIRTYYSNVDYSSSPASTTLLHQRFISSSPPHTAEAALSSTPPPPPPPSTSTSTLSNLTKATVHQQLLTEANTFFIKPKNTYYAYEEQSETTTMINTNFNDDHHDKNNNYRRSNDHDKNKRNLTRINGNEFYLSDDDDENGHLKNHSNLPPIKSRSKLSRYHTTNRSSATNIADDTSGYISDSENLQNSSSPDIWINDNKQHQRKSRSKMRLPPTVGQQSQNIKQLAQTIPYPATHRHQIPAINSNNKKFNDSGDCDIDFNTSTTPPNYCGTPQSSSPSDSSRDFLMSSSSYSGDLTTTGRYKKNRDERAKWGDRGVTIGHFYDTATASVKQGPDWLERGLIADNRNGDSGDESVATSYSFIRGQNTPIDATTLAERATKRLKAMEFQQAIKEQLAERERLRKKELEIIQIEERRQEEIKRQELEFECEKQEFARRQFEEKCERERKKQEIMEAALEKAALEAQLEKEKRKQEKALLIGSTAIAPPPPPPSSQSSQQSSPHLTISSNEIELLQPPLTPPLITSDNVLDNKIHNKNGYDQYQQDQSSNNSEKILIGTPIRYKKKIIPKPKEIKINKSSESLETSSLYSEKVSTTFITDPNELNNNKIVDSGGIALVLQALPPPMLTTASTSATNQSNAQQINLNNLQFAIMLANQIVPLQQQHQQQQLQQKQEIDQHISLLMTQPTSVNAGEKCKICGGHQNPEKDEEQKLIEIPIEIANTTESLEIVDKDDTVLTTPPTTSSGKKDIVFNDDMVIIPDKTEAIDVATQTYHCHTCDECCHLNHESYSEKITHISRASLKCNQNEEIISSGMVESKDCLTEQDKPDDVKEDTTTAISLTIGRSKSKESKHIEDRPKWGVNRPVQQYVKASDRDPFYMKNCRIKKFIKHRSQTADVVNSNGIICLNKITQIEEQNQQQQQQQHQEQGSITTVVSRSTSPTSETVILPKTIHTQTNNVNSDILPPSIHLPQPLSSGILSRPQGQQLLLSSTPSSSSSSSVSTVLAQPKISRNIFTKILPIKTDCNGKVFLNFQDAVFELTEKQIKQNIKPPLIEGHLKKRIMNRRKTIDGILNTFE